MKTIEIPQEFDTTVEQEKIEQLKKLFFEEYEKNPDLYDNRDLDHLKNSDLHAVRFLIAGENNVQASLEALKTGLKWRKSFNLHDLTEESFPEEFFNLAGLFECGQDRFGFPCVYVRVKTVRKVKMLDLHQMQFLAYTINKIERRCERLQCWTLVFDCMDIGFCNVNLSLIHFLIDLLHSYFPLSVRYAIVLDVPWILNAIQKFVLSLLPDNNRKLIRFINRKNLTNYIIEENIPTIMGGTCTKNIFEHSLKCKSIKVLAKELYNLEHDETEKIMKPYQNLLKETEMFRKQKIKNESFENVNNSNFKIIKTEEYIEVMN